MEQNSGGCRDLFLWVSSIIGFIVDTIALISIAGGMINGNVSTIGAPSFPKLEFGNLLLEWKDITLVLLIYVFIAFSVISVPNILRENGWIIHSFLTHFIIALFGLWLLVFAPFGDTKFYLHLSETWVLVLVGLFLSYWRVSTARETTIPWAVIDTVKVLFFPIIITIPAWTLIEKGLFNTTWVVSLSTVLKWTLVGIIGYPFLWALPFLAIFTISLLYFGMLRLIFRL